MLFHFAGWADEVENEKPQSSEEEKTGQESNTSESTGNYSQNSLKGTKNNIF